MPIELFNLDLDHNLRAKREAKAAEQGFEPCTHCGRGVKPGAGWVTVVLGGGSTVAHPDSITPEDESDAGFMGTWVLGSTCAKIIPLSTRAKWNGWGN